MSQPPPSQLSASAPGAMAAVASKAVSQGGTVTVTTTSSSTTTVTSAGGVTTSTNHGGSSNANHALAASSCSHINVCRPWLSWKKGNISEYVSKPRVFFDHFHHEIVLFTGSPPNKMWCSQRNTLTWRDYPIHLPPHNDIIGAQFSPDRSHVALRVSDKEVKVLSTVTGEVVTARSCRGTSSRMISVHWLHDPQLAKTAAASSLFLLFVTNAGVELYELTSDKAAGAGGSSISGSGAATSSSNLTGASTNNAPGGAASAATAQQKNKLRHIKTATYQIVWHWILLDENILLLVDSKNVFQCYKLSSKQIVKMCKFELDCANTSLIPPPSIVQFHREQITLLWLYGRMVIIFVNEQKGQLHMLALANSGGTGAGQGGAGSSSSGSDEMEQTNVFELFKPGKYDISCLDNILVVHNTATRVSMLFDVRSEAKTTITEPLPIGPPLNQQHQQQQQSIIVGGNASSGSGNQGCFISFFDPNTDPTPPPGAGASAISTLGRYDCRPSPGYLSLAPATFHPYIKWTFLSPCFVWESTGDQQQGNLWTLEINYQQIAYSWPSSKRGRLIDFLLKRYSLAAKQLILQILLHIVCTEPASLALLSRLFSLINRMNYDHRMTPNAPLQAGMINLASLPLLPPFSNPSSAASTQPNSSVSSPAPTNGAAQAPGSIVHTRAQSQSVSPYAYPSLVSAAAAAAAASAAAGGKSTPPHFGAPSSLSSSVGGQGAASLGQSPLRTSLSGLPSFSANQQAQQQVASPLSSSFGHRSALSHSQSFSVTSPPDHAATAAATAAGGTAAGSVPSAPSSFPNSLSSSSLNGAVFSPPLSYDLDDSLSVLSCEMLDIPAMLAQPLTIEHNIHGYILISQLDIFLHVFEKARAHIPLAQLIPVVVEYLRSIHRHFLRTEDILNDFLVSLLLQAGRHYEFHQYLQYHILNDSLPIANRLISVAPQYPPAYQLGIDMLYRLNQIPRLIRVLLQHHQVLAALQLIPNYKVAFLDATPGLMARDFLQVAWNSGCSITFYNTYRFFEQRNIALRGQAAFLTGDGCEEFVLTFHQLFAAHVAAQNAAVQSALSGGVGGTSATPNPKLAGSITADVGKQLQAPTSSVYLNLGDDDDEDQDDDDIEYDGQKPSMYAVPVSLDERAPASPSSAAMHGAGAGSALSTADPTSADFPPTHAPIDLSASTSLATGGGGEASRSSSMASPPPSGLDDDEDAGDSGLGNVVPSAASLDSEAAAAAAAANASSPTDSRPSQSPVLMDGSFGGSGGGTL